MVVGVQKRDEDGKLEFLVVFVDALDQILLAALFRRQNDQQLPQHKQPYHQGKG